MRQRQKCWWRTREIKHYLFSGTFPQEFPPSQPTDPTHSMGKPKDPLIFIQIPRIHNIFHQPKSVSLKLLSDINYSKIRFLTLSKQMFLEWPCCTAGTTFPFCIFLSVFSNTTLSFSSHKTVSHKLLKNHYPISQNRHQSMFFLLALESTARIQTLWIVKPFSKHTPG